MQAQKLPEDSCNDRTQKPSSPENAEEPSRPKRSDYIGRLESAIQDYLREAQVPEFQRLCELRKKGWENPAGDAFFAKQRQTADNADDKTARHFYTMMLDIGKDMNRQTGVFSIEPSSPTQQPAILDMCMAPGGFLATALALNPTAQALAFSLPPEEGGHNVALDLAAYPNVTAHLCDITMLAADIGVSSAEIPVDHPDVHGFLPAHFNQKKFDLAFCDGQVLRTHARASYREKREATRLTLTQLILSLSHLKPGGTMIVLSHKIEAPAMVQMLYEFSRFSTVTVYKHAKFHAKRSSFYMIASGLKVDSEEAVALLERWRRKWKSLVLDMKLTDERFAEMAEEGAPTIEEILDTFGERLIEMGRTVWGVQAEALGKAPFIKSKAEKSGSWRS
ncbi:uncharacterized protein DSM5745_09634 [Aspergillus mulundensis]|uniref:Ribosomal RNA methyltransferase FtsJ domain-containing protein n=1 Tax=Aspergillus mulundensis TaxID=1810919 RepID=A0A3D8QVU3_9EURO|nr:Uncharacterized protein DSM5745_09634 [Aspergillus mulundensis]RDW65895.1 Uncharacterized protein DSM5745_09634 [Aspergillus mulundensis]